jgi:branched-chain amino acid aminotransferase
VTALTYKTQRTTDDTVAVGAKVGNYLVAVLAMQEAKRVGANEALIVDRLGRIVEGATSNVFMVKAGRLVTPPESAGILAGITRALVIQAAEREGIAVTFDCPTVQALLDADEVFVTSSIRQMLALIEVDGHPIGSRSPGPLFRRLVGVFHEVVQEQMKLDEQ